MPDQTNEAAAPDVKSMRDQLHDFKRNRVLDVASQLFYEAGYSKTSIDAIADQLHVTKPFIYYHFDSKADILAGVCGRTTAFVAELAEEAANSKGSPRQRLGDLVRNMTLRIIEGRVYLAVYFREEKHLPEEAQIALAGYRRRFDQAMRALLQQGVDAKEFKLGHIAVAEQAITGMTTWVFNWYRPDRRLSAEDIAENMAQLTLSMVSGRST
ncbi:TetR/AcrR family transcriptional regulator [Variovorax sp. dw_308]|uniref:TetR/AcrR family transcriptional regulator n=1 Tax=Variovorax sp. dw_308 TaxID=2721546 RepID=UPI001C493394|nr:TetR/AcrR family transcriptional regulator [Variovorax sp. dw_308]